MSSPVEALRENFAPAAAVALTKHKLENRTPVADATTPRDATGNGEFDSLSSILMPVCDKVDATPASVFEIVMVHWVELVYCMLIWTLEVGATVDGEKAEIKLVVAELSAAVQDAAVHRNTDVFEVVKRTS